MSILESTVEKLKVLPDEKVEAVSRYIDSLTPAPKKGRFDDLLGSMAHEEVDRMERAIHDACEQIHPEDYDD